MTLETCKWKKVLTHSEVTEIVNNLNESINDSKCDSFGNSNNEINNIAVADGIINDDSLMKRKYCTEISGGRLWTVTQDTEKCSVVVLGSEMVRKV
jgi:hypothetical protein